MISPISNTWPLSALSFSTRKRSPSELDSLRTLSGQEVLDHVIEGTWDGSLWADGKRPQELDLHRESIQQGSWRQARVEITPAKGKKRTIELSDYLGEGVDSLALDELKSIWDESIVYEGTKVELIPIPHLNVNDPILLLALEHLILIASSWLHNRPDHLHAAVDFFEVITVQTVYDWFPRGSCTSPIPAKGKEKTGLWIKGLVANGLDALSRYLRRMGLLTEDGKFVGRD